MEAAEILKNALRKYNTAMRKKNDPEHCDFNPNRTIEEYKYEEETLKEILKDITDSINEDIQGIQQIYSKIEKMKKEKLEKLNKKRNSILNWDVRIYKIK